jgi:hypothetical protein
MTRFDGKKRRLIPVCAAEKVLRATSMNQKFPYILRIGEKAKRVRFQVSAEKGLEIVIPKRFSMSRVPSLVERTAIGSNGLSRRRPSKHSTSLRVNAAPARDVIIIYLRFVAITLNNLGILEGAENYLEEALKNLPQACAERARDKSTLRGDNTQRPRDNR